MFVADVVAAVNWCCSHDCHCYCYLFLLLLLFLLLFFQVVTSRAYGPAVDIYATGVVLFTLLAGYPPFMGRTDYEIMQKCKTGEHDRVVAAVAVAVVLLTSTHACGCVSNASVKDSRAFFCS